MSDSKKEMDKIQKKLKDLAANDSRTTLMLFSYIEALLKLLSDKGLTNAAEFNEYLVRARKELTGKLRDAEFKKMMSQFGDEEKPEKK